MVGARTVLRGLTQWHKLVLNIPCNTGLEARRRVFFCIADAGSAVLYSGGGKASASRATGGRVGGIAGGSGGGRICPGVPNGLA